MAESDQSKPPEKPLPIPDATSREFFEGAKNGRLTIQHCEDCGCYRVIAGPRCDACRSANLTFVAASGQATLFTFAVMHQRYHPAFYDELPYPLAVVELEEGPRLLTSLVGVESAQLKMGMKLKAVFVEIGQDIFLPKFTPA